MMSALNNRASYTWICIFTAHNYLLQINKIDKSKIFDLSTYIFSDKENNIQAYINLFITFFTVFDGIANPSPSKSSPVDLATIRPTN